MTPTLKSLPRRQGGFTLIELVIALAIVAILASIAMPSYQGYVRRGQLADAFTTLADMRVKMEQYYQDNKFYGSASNATTCPQLPGYSAFPVATKYFSVDCGPGSANATPLQTFKLTAAGTGGLTTGYQYTLDNAGTKGTDKFANNSTTAACWMTKASTCDN
ncbi:MAG TPA: type IV pilin protein [Burkholderiaceae bacterium]|nr:type IV pilin protein [Burkholderiaceae bacterium]